MNRLQTEAVTLGYAEITVVDQVDVSIADGEFTVIIGPNGCGKSTLLRGLARLLRPSGGSVLLDGKDIHRYKTAEVARRMALLPQNQTIPSSVKVADLVSRGRFAHQGFLRRWSSDDAEAVDTAMRDADVAHLATAEVSALSGGQRQRVWLATVLAQQTPILLLDEPTTYLDIAHQMEVLELCTRLHAAGRTVAAVLHDLNHAARVATRIVAMREGKVVANGTPQQVLTPATVEEVFGWPCLVVDDPVTQGPLVVPHNSRMAVR